MAVLFTELRFEVPPGHLLSESERVACVVPNRYPARMATGS